MRGGAGEAVQNNALLGIGLLETLAHQVDDQVIGNQIACVHVAFSLQTELGLILHGSAQNVARGDVRNTEFFNQKSSLRTLAGTRSAEKNNIHAFPPLT